MQRLYVALTDREYEMTSLQERLRMRNDLVMVGFFNESENKSFWEVLEQESPDKEQVRQFMNSIKLFEIQVTKEKVTEQN